MASVTLGMDLEQKLQQSKDLLITILRSKSSKFSTTFKIATFSIFFRMNDNFHPSVTWDVPISERDVTGSNLRRSIIFLISIIEAIKTPFLKILNLI